MEGKEAVTRTLVLLVAFVTMAAVAPATAAATLPMQVSVYPNPMRADTHGASVQVRTMPHIICVAFVLYDNGLLPITFPHARAAVTSSHGIASWVWSDPPRASAGTASVSCTAGALTRTVNVHFAVLPDAPPRPTPRPAPQAFVVRAVISPNPARAASNAVLAARTAAGARCFAGVVYGDGTAARTFVGTPRSAGDGEVAWRWRVDTASSIGTATVTCSWRGQLTTATVLFTITHR